MLDQVHMVSLFENATEGILLSDSNGILTLANPAALKMFGYTENEMLGNKIEILLPNDIHAKHVDLRQGFTKHPGNRSMGSGRDLFARNKSGEVFPVEVSLSHYQKDNKMFVIAFVVDITQRKEIEKNLIKKQTELENVTHEIRKLNTELELRVDERTHILKEALQKLEQSQNELSEALDKERQLNEIKSRFVSMASHEFRTPLSAVLSSASLLSKYTKEDEQEKRDRHIIRIKESVKHLNDILEDFLSLGRLNEGRVAADPSLFNLNEMIEETLSDLRLLLKEGQIFKTRYETSEIIYADKKLLKNILFNLLSNAIKFSGENSEIELDAVIKEGSTEITITDHGIGISAEDQQHLFSSFYRGSNANNIQGTGLGLHIVKRYADLLKGSVHLQSKQGVGTTVKISFPSTQID
jgi:PAS domain S-box-containing protein